MHGGQFAVPLPHGTADGIDDDNITFGHGANVRTRSPKSMRDALLVIHIVIAMVGTWGG
jgi:hypothetical protein